MPKAALGSSNFKIQADRKSEGSNHGRNIHISVNTPEHNDLDHASMVRLIAGDDLALNELMERWQKPLLSFILRYVGNYADSIELAQETFVRVYRHRSRFNFKSKFSTWLLTIATNLCKHHARWRNRHPTTSLDDAAGMDEMFDEHLSISAEEIPSALASRSELAKLVKEEIEKLPHDLKTAILLFAYDNLSYAEIGLILGCTPKAVETRLYRVRKVLARRLIGIF
jgi:RNA polymerase sigma-70 factor (ECF subfamily)